jgi:hypothetical protein
VLATIKTGDTVSYVCGSAGTGLDYCGSRIISLIIKQHGNIITAPFLTFDHTTNQIIIQVTNKSDVGFY